MNLIRNFFILVLFANISTLSFGQQFKFTLADLPSDTVYLAKYFGKKPYYADTAITDKKGVAIFDGSKHQGGVMALVTDVSYFQFVHDDEEIDIYIDSVRNPIKTMEIRKSASNQAFYNYIDFMGEKKKLYAEISKDEKDEDKKKEKLKAVDEEIDAYQRKLIKDLEGKFISDMVKMSRDIELPEPPKDADGNITDSSFVYQYYINHYWDDVNLKDPRIVRTEVFHNKLDKYFSNRGILQVPDTIFKYAKKMIAQMDWEDQSNQVFQYTVHHITNKYESSNIMGMDRVFVLMAKEYYCAPNEHAWWVTKEVQDKICERAEKLGRTMVGEFAPFIKLPDSTQTTWYSNYDIDAEWTILFFWDPNCGHCKKVTPKLQTLYEKKFKERGIEVMAIGKATGADFEKWKLFIQENGLTFLNVGLTKDIYNQALEDPRPLLKTTTLESLNYSDTWDIYSTPRMFVLDKDKVIRFKQLSMSQLEDIMDKVTGHADDEKIFPLEEEPEDEKLDD